MKFLHFILGVIKLLFLYETEKRGNAYVYDFNN